MEIYLKNWFSKFFEEISKTKSLRIISPFIKEQVVRRIYNSSSFKNVEIITRFNLCDFASGISSIDALKYAIEKDAVIYGIKDLHSKIYLFDKRSAIVTSANLTMNGLVKNYECGIYLTDAKAIDQLHKYFNELSFIGNYKLSTEQCEQWKLQLSNMEIVNTNIPAYPDFGASPISIDSTKNYYVKFLGNGSDRVPLSFTTKEEINRALCHYACGFSIKKKPRQINNDDIIYLARMTYDPYDYAIFGRAEAIKFVEGRDIASEYEKKERTWKNDYPVYLRLKKSKFINGILGDCILLSDIINKFDYESFDSTSRRYLEGERSINPIKALMQKPYIKLTPKSAGWLESRFSETISLTGKVSSQFIKTLPISKI